MPYLKRCAISSLVLVLLADTHAQTPPTSWQYQVGQFNVSVVPRPVSGVAPDPYVVRIETVGTSQFAEVAIGAGYLLDVRAWNSQRITVFFGDEAKVIDLPSAQLVDHFLYARKTVSPDGRFIAFTRVLPRWAADQSAVYLVYDVSGTASSNRMVAGEQGLARERNAGWALYPEINQATHSYMQDDPLDHEPRSQLQWLDGSHIAFVDLQRSADAASLWVIVANLGPGTTLAQVRSISLSLSQIVNELKVQGRRPAEAVWVEDIIPLQVTSSSYLLKLLIKSNEATIVKELEVSL